MKKYLFILLISITGVLAGCSTGQNKSGGGELSTSEFSEKINKLPSAQLIDVRTPEEFEKGHLQNAKNVDWNGDNFQSQISVLDKSKPVFVYCLSGGRSSSAASKMRDDGFKEVYELSGGIMKWRGAGLPETTDNNSSASSGMTMQQFDEQLNSDKSVLIDFYAEWCAPCKRMAPYLEEISKEMSDKVLVIRINSDENISLCKELKIDALPTLQLYKNKKLSWTNSGYLSKEDIVKALK